jgi:hypothetical protein
MTETTHQAPETETRPRGAEPPLATEAQPQAAPAASTAPHRIFSQSEVDQIVTKALRTREENLTSELEERFASERRGADEERLAETGQWRELSERHQTELERLRAENQERALTGETASMLAEKGLSSLARVFDLDFASIEGRSAAAELMAAVVADGVEARVGQRLELPAPARGATPAPPADLDGQIHEAERKGDWARSLVLKDRKLRQMHERARPGAAA